MDGPEDGGHEMFHQENADVLRYRKDYDLLLTQKNSANPNLRESVADSFTSYDAIYYGIITNFKKHGQIQAYIKEVAAATDQRISTADPSAVEEEVYLQLIFSQLAGDDPLPEPLQKYSLARVGLETVSRLSANYSITFKSRRRLEVFFKVFLYRKDQMKQQERVFTLDQIYDNLLAITSKNKVIDTEYKNFKGLFSYDRFMFEMITIARLKVYKEYQGSLNKNEGVTHWLVQYMLEVCRILKSQEVKKYYTPALMTHFTWELLTTCMTISQFEVLEYSTLMKQIDVDFLHILCPEFMLSNPKSYTELCVCLFWVFCHYYKHKESLSAEKLEQPKYDDTNLLDLKLQEFFVINFSGIKVELHDYFNNLKENLFPRQLSIFNSMHHSSLGTLNFFNKYFTVNHNMNFKVGLAFVLLQHKEYGRSENLLKQILEKAEPGTFTKIWLLYKLAALLFLDHVDDPHKALLFTKELLNLAPKTNDKKSMELSHLHLLHAAVYFKLAHRTRYDALRITNKSNALDNLKIALDFDPDNSVAQMLKGVMLMDIGFSQREGLKLIQSVNQNQPQKFLPMMSLAISFTYCQDIERSFIVANDCCKRFTSSKNRYITYLLCAHIKVQDILQKYSEQNPIQVTFPEELVLELKEIQPKEPPKLIITEAQIAEIEALMRKAINALLRAYSVKSADSDINIPRITELLASDQANTDPVQTGAEDQVSVLIKYEQVLLYWAKLMISIKRYDKIEPVLLAFDYKSNSRQNFYHVDEVNYLLAKLNFEQGDYINCQDYLRKVLKDEHVHHDAFILMAALHFKNKDLVSQAESEAWLLSALSLGETAEGLQLLAEHKLAKQDDANALELLLRAMNISNTRPLFTFSALNLTLAHLFE